MTQSGIEADIICYNAVIDACAKARDAKGAEQWMKQMLVKGVVANTVTYNAVINACAKVGDAACAEKWMKKISHRLTHELGATLRG